MRLGHRHARPYGNEEQLTDRLTLEIDAPIAVITNNSPEKRNAFDDVMDQRLFEILAELRERNDVRAVIWRGEGKSFTSGRDVGAIGGSAVEPTPSAPADPSDVPAPRPATLIVAGAPFPSYKRTCPRSATRRRA
jgi:enoyl-CoA hydratase/carnithine racemase